MWLLQARTVKPPYCRRQNKQLLRPSMSRLITNTNCLVDDFDFCKSFPKDTFIHFLTHFHGDHYQGLSPRWDYGRIMCTHQTKRFLMDRYPKISRVEGHDYGVFYPLCLTPELRLQYCFLDAKHIPGSAMILFKGFMGSILFTGDFRYEYQMVDQNPLLFPPNLRGHLTKQSQVQSQTGIGIHIDEMIFDNTYCHPSFNFGTQSQILDKVIGIIEKNRHVSSVLIVFAALGKHRMLVRLAQHFQTSIVVSQLHMRRLELSGYETHSFTTVKDAGFIEMVSGSQRTRALAEMNSKGKPYICINTDFLMLDHQAPDQCNYIVPYSLHSNFREMSTLVRMLKPCILRKLVLPPLKHLRHKITVNHRLKFSKYLQFLAEKVETSDGGYAAIVRSYTDITGLSKSFLKCMDPQTNAHLMRALGLGDGSQNHSLRRNPIFEEEPEQRSNKKSLSQIAAQLNAVNRNLTIEDSLSRGQSIATEDQCLRLFTDTFSQSNTGSISRSQTVSHYLTKGSRNINFSESQQTNQSQPDGDDDNTIFPSVKHQECSQFQDSLYCRFLMVDSKQSHVGKE